jgi:AbrB family looped-hinge helix DNA binding protein
MTHGSLNAMKTETIRIDKAGRVVLPKPLRDQFNLLPGGKLRQSIEGNGFRLEPADVIVACRPIFKSAHGIHGHGALEGEQAALLGMLARMPAGLLTAASCCWMSFSARRMNAAFSSALLMSMISLASCWV